MKIAFVVSAFALLLAAVPARADFCSKYEGNEAYLRAVSVVAKAMQYSPAELCSLPRLADIHVTRRNILNERQEVIPHVWVTLHYNEYSCQYFVRESDSVVTSKNCYNTW